MNEGDKPQAIPVRLAGVSAFSRKRRESVPPAVLTPHASDDLCQWSDIEGKNLEA